MHVCSYYDRSLVDKELRVSTFSPSPYFFSWLHYLDLIRSRDVRAYVSETCSFPFMSPLIDIFVIVC